MGQLGDHPDKAVNSSGEFGQKLMKALGLEKHQVISITIESQATKPVLVKVEKLLSQKEAIQMLPILEEYNLVKKENNAVDS